MELKEKTLERIIENERIVTQMESMNNFMIEELGGCRNHVTPLIECYKYGIDFTGLTSAFLACYLKTKEN
jgi:hypothetical protein